MHFRSQESQTEVVSNNRGKNSMLRIKFRSGIFLFEIENIFVKKLKWDVATQLHSGLTYYFQLGCASDCFGQRIMSLN